MINGCYYPPSPFVIITQPESWYSFYCPTEGGRLSPPRHWRVQSLCPRPYIAVAVLVNTCYMYRLLCLVLTQKPSAFCVVFHCQYVVNRLHELLARCRQVTMRLHLYKQCHVWDSGHLTAGLKTSTLSQSHTRTVWLNEFSSNGCFTGILKWWWLCLICNTFYASDLKWYQLSGAPVSRFFGDCATDRHMVWDHCPVCLFVCLWRWCIVAERFNGWRCNLARR